MQVGDRVVKDKGDYRFEGIIVARFKKRGGDVRYVVEDDRGLLFIFNGTQLMVIAQGADYVMNGVTPAAET